LKNPFDLETTSMVGSPVFRYGTLLLSILFWPVSTSADDPNADPARDVVRKLLKDLATSAEGNKPAEGAGRASSEQVIDELAAGPSKVTPEELIATARQSEKQGRWHEALRLARAARRLAPDDASIDAYVKLLQMAVADRDASQSTLSRATAHLAAGLTRGQDLMETGRYSQAVDLLEHVVKASALFPSTANVGLYARLADRELKEYQARVEDGSIVPDVTATTKPVEEPILVSTGAAAPVNARRVLRPADAPRWYAELKNRLAFPMTVDYQRESVAAVLEKIGEKTGVKILLDSPVVSSRSHLQNHVDLRIADVSAERILDLACAKGGLEYVLMEKGVVVTTPSRAVRYLRDLPDSVSRNWLAARVIFPDLSPTLANQPPLPNALPSERMVEADEEDRDLPAYLRSGSALLADIQSILKSP
jgi:hypothetical protein